MEHTNWKRPLAAVAAISFGAWEAFHWMADVGGREPWSFGLGFTSAALIFGFWDLAGPERPRIQRKPLEDAPGIEGIDVRLAELINEGQEMSEREKKAAERIAHYHGG